MPSRNTPPKKVAPRKTTPSRALTTRDAQAAAEGVDIVGGAEKVTFMGQEFRIADRIGLMPLMHLAIASRKGVDAGDMDGLAAMYEVIRDCIDEGDWARFEQHAVDSKAEADDIQQVVTDVLVTLSARPSKRPGGSSAGPLRTSASSKGSSPRTDTPLPDDGMVSVEDLMGR